MWYQDDRDNKNLICSYIKQYSKLQNKAHVYVERFNLFTICSVEFFSHFIPNICHHVSNDLPDDNRYEVYPVWSRLFFANIRKAITALMVISAICQKLNKFDWSYKHHLKDILWWLKSAFVGSPFKKLELFNANWCFEM